MQLQDIRSTILSIVACAIDKHQQTLIVGKLSGAANQFFQIILHISSLPQVILSSHIYQYRATDGAILLDGGCRLDGYGVVVFRLQKIFTTCCETEHCCCGNDAHEHLVYQILLYLHNRTFFICCCFLFLVQS